MIANALVGLEVAESVSEETILRALTTRLDLPILTLPKRLLLRSMTRKVNDSSPQDTLLVGVRYLRSFLGETNRSDNWVNA